MMYQMNDLRAKYDLLLKQQEIDKTDIVDDTPMKRLQQNYRTLCKKHHPDKEKLETEDRSTDKFIEIQSAYETLKSILDGTDVSELNILIKVVVARSEMYFGCRRQFNINRIKNETTDTYGAVVVVPPGAYNGQVLTLVDGGHIIGSQVGQLHIHLEEYNDTQFIRDGSNLILNLNVTLTQALIGDPVQIHHFQSLINVPVRIPHTNYTHILPGMGMPVLSTKQFGDMYIKYHVIFPSLDPLLVQSLMSATYAGDDESPATPCWTGTREGPRGVP